MNRPSTLLTMAALILAGPVLPAEDFSSLMNTSQATWPEKRHIGVICDYRVSEAQVAALAKAAPEGSLITVADTRSMAQANVAAQIIADQRADFLVLLPRDRFFQDGSFATTQVVRQLAARGVPSVGTTPAALKQGAVFSVGDGTNGELLVTSRLIGTVDVILPGRAALNQKAALVLRREGTVTIAVHAAE